MSTGNFEFSAPTGDAVCDIHVPASFAEAAGSLFMRSNRHEILMFKAVPATRVVNDKASIVAYRKIFLDGNYRFQSIINSL